MNKVTKILIGVFLVLIVTSLTVICCIKINRVSFINKKSVKTVPFHRGVYKSFSISQKNQYNYYYIFDDEQSGHTEETERGIGLPFSCIQTENSVRFKFGGITEPEEVLEIKSIDSEGITGSYGNGELLKFIPIPNANPDNFNAEGL